MADIQWLGVLAAFAAAFFANFLYFGPKTMFPLWWRALGRGDEQPGQGMNMGLVFGLTTVGTLVQAVVMTFVVRGAQLLAGADEVSLALGALAGFVVGVGIAAATSLGHRMFAGQGVLVWAIEVGGDIIGLTLMGAVLSFWY